MKYRVKKWEKFQHFKDRRPPWIKLYRDLLEDPDWHDLEPEAAKALVALWLIASEDENREGVLPCHRTIAFRLRTTETKAKQILTKLSHWLISDDITEISGQHQADTPETETETETETEKRKRQNALAEEITFEIFWEAYPCHENKAKAHEKWRTKKCSDHFRAIIQAIEVQKTKRKWQEGIYAHPATWLNQERWNDTFEHEHSANKKTHGRDSAGVAMLRKMGVINGLTNGEGIDSGNRPVLPAVVGLPQPGIPGTHVDVLGIGTGTGGDGRQDGMGGDTGLPPKQTGRWPPA